MCQVKSAAQGALDARVCMTWRGSRGAPLKIIDLRPPKAATYYGGRLLVSRLDQHEPSAAMQCRRSRLR
jgi:hypothetical protein